MPILASHPEDSTGKHPEALSCHHISHDMVRHALQDNWEHLPHDLLVAVVKHLQPQDAKGMHRVCRSWHLAVRCGLQSMKPTPKLTPFYDVRDYFPRVSLCARGIRGDSSFLLPNSAAPYLTCTLQPPHRALSSHPACCPMSACQRMRQCRLGTGWKCCCMLTPFTHVSALTRTGDAGQLAAPAELHAEGEAPGPAGDCDSPAASQPGQRHPGGAQHHPEAHLPPGKPHRHTLDIRCRTEASGTLLPAQ